MDSQLPRFKLMPEAQYQKVLAQVAQAHNATPEEAERDILQSIDAAWSTTDPLAKARQSVLFKGLGRKPTPREFLSAMVDQLSGP